MEHAIAKACGLSSATVSHLAGGLEAASEWTFKLSRDPQFIEKVRDIVGLYLHPPERAVVMCVDEKPQIQALDRSQPVLPMRPGLPERRTHDYRRHGTTALDVATGSASATSATAPSNSAITVRQGGSGRPGALVLDNYGTHKTG